MWLLLPRMRLRDPVFGRTMNQNDSTYQTNGARTQAWWALCRRGKHAEFRRDMVCTNGGREDRKMCKERKRKESNAFIS